MNKHKWDAEGYHKSSSAQLNASLCLLKKINFSGFENILDIGSGDGKISAQLSQKVPKGSVIGIDNSPEMISFSQSKFSAKNYPNLSFTLKDAQVPTFSKSFDLIFSSFCLQLILDIDTFLSHIYKIIVPKGLFIATIPAGIPEGIKISLHKMMNKPMWSKYFYDFKETWVFRTANEVSKALASYKFSIQFLDTVFQKETFLSKSDLEHYLKYSFPHIYHVPNQMQPLFIDELIKEYLEIEPINKNGLISFNFSRLDLISKKI